MTIILSVATAELKFKNYLKEVNIMGNIGDVSRNPSSSDSISEMVGLRCPVGECKVIEISDVSGYTAGTIKVRSDLLVLPFQSETSGIIIGAYEVPRLLADAFPASAIIAGEKLHFAVGVDGSKSNLFVTQGSQVQCTAIALEAKAAGVSEVLVHFNGAGFLSQPGNDGSTSDALYVA